MQYSPEPTPKPTPCWLRGSKLRPKRSSLRPSISLHNAYYNSSQFVGVAAVQGTSRYPIAVSKASRWLPVFPSSWLYPYEIPSEVIGARFFPQCRSNRPWNVDSRYEVGLESTAAKSRQGAHGCLNEIERQKKYLAELPRTSIFLFSTRNGRWSLSAKIAAPKSNSSYSSLVTVV